MDDKRLQRRSAQPQPQPQPQRDAQASPISFAADQFGKERELRLGYEQGFHRCEGIT